MASCNDGAAPAGDHRPLISVVAGVLSDAAGRVLIARRPEGAHGGGFWEFPGGKLAPGEAAWDGLCRELHEELGITVLGGTPLLRCRHAYPDRTVELDFYRVERYAGTASGREGQPLRWVSVAELSDCGLLPADLPVIAALNAAPDAQQR